jgi:single-strand DNA-binding protein
MALNLNHVVVAGRLTRDPQVKVLASDKAVAEFGLAINRRWKGADGEYKEESTFLEVEAWARTAELVGQYLAKGSPVYVEGRLRLDNWQDKDGHRRTRVKIVAETVQFLAGRKDGAAPDPAGEAAPTAARPPRAQAPAAVAYEAEAEAAKDAPPF